MENNDLKRKKFLEGEEFIVKLRANKLEIPNKFTEEMGQIIKNAREEKGMSQSQLAEEMSRRQATISDLENGKTEIGIFTLIVLSRVFNKPISFFIPKMSFLATVNDLQNEREEEALMLFRELEYEGDSQLALEFLKMLTDYYLRDNDQMNEEPKE